MIIEDKDPKRNYFFAKDVKGADVEAHGQVIIECEIPMWNEWFKEVLKDEYKRNNFIDDTYNFIDNALDEMIEEDNEENKYKQKRS